MSIDWRQPMFLTPGLMLSIINLGNHKNNFTIRKKKGYYTLLFINPLIWSTGVQKRCPPELAWHRFSLIFTLCCEVSGFFPSNNWREVSLTEIRKDQINTGLFVKDRVTGLTSSEQLEPMDYRLLTSLLMGSAANPLSSQLAKGERPL